ncbi:MAG: hypothetical protein SGARI_003287 [Bacillariaceae sp.]
MHCWDGKLNAILDFRGFQNRHRAFALEKWMTKHRIHLRSLAVRGLLADIPHLMETIRRCHTENLTKASIYINREESATSTAAYPETLRAEMGISREVDCKEQKILHDVIASECPNLRDLKVDLTLASESPDRSDYVSQALFSKASIVKLSIKLHGFTERYGNPQLEGHLFTDLIANLPSLKTLEIDCEFERS